MNRYFSTSPIYSAPVANIDRELGIIHGVTIAQIGPAKGHGGFIDRTFLLQIVDNAASKTAGIKARFGHPNMCSQALGTYLGRFKNYSYLSDKVKADLYLDDTARSTPGGDLFTYILDMTEKNPDMFGASIVFEIADSVFIKEDMDGKEVEKEYFRLKDLRATDIVDEPAATDGLFSVRLGGAEAFPAIATQFLDENPEILEFIFSKPDSVTEFLTNYITNSKMNFSEKIRQNFAAFLATFSVQPADQTDQSQQPDVVPDTTLNALFEAVSASYPDSFTEIEGFTQLQKAESLTAFFASFNEQLSAADTKLTESTTAFDTLNTEHQALLADLETERQSLSAANTRITELTEQLSARPSIPLNVTDPLLNLTPGDQEKDETGKQILAAMPKDIKRKLKQS
jgi:hypothetical protein